MATMQIKNIPEDVQRVYRQRAAAAGQSLQEYMLGRLIEGARQPTPEEFWERVSQRTGGSMPPAEAVRYIREDRERR